MKTAYAFLLTTLALSGSLQAQAANAAAAQDMYTFQVLVRVDAGDTGTNVLELASGAMGAIELGSGLRLDITAPGLAPKGTESAVFVLRHLQGEKWLPQHTFRQPLRGKREITLGYLVCREQVTLIYPVGATLPGC